MPVCSPRPQVTAVSAPLRETPRTTRCAWTWAGARTASACPSVSGSSGWSPARVTVSTAPACVRPAGPRAEDGGGGGGWRRTPGFPSWPLTVVMNAALSVSLPGGFSGQEAAWGWGRRALGGGPPTLVPSCPACCLHPTGRESCSPRISPKDVHWACCPPLPAGCPGQGPLLAMVGDIMLASLTLVLSFPHSVRSPWV